MKIIGIILSCALAVRAFPQDPGYSLANAAPAETAGFADDAFQFAYAVASPEHGTYHGHQATRDLQGHTSGSYYVLAADGNWRQTIYADKGLGFQAVSNQRPAGSPPPQASAVNYQIFVHPGATAVSASGAGPIGGENFNFPTLEATNRQGAPASALAPASFQTTASSNVNFAVQAPATAPINFQTSAAAPVNIAVQNPAAAPINVQAPAPAPINFAVGAPAQGPVNIQAPATAPVNLAVGALDQEPINIQAPATAPVNLAVGAPAQGLINIQSPAPAPFNLAVGDPAPGPISIQASAPSPVNLGARAPAQGAFNIQAPAPASANFGVRFPAPEPIKFGAPSASFLNLAVRTEPQSSGTGRTILPKDVKLAIEALAARKRSGR